jgi:hypothetical protein
MMPHLVLVLHIALADRVAWVEQRAIAGLVSLPKLAGMYAVIGVSLLLCADLWNVASRFHRWVPQHAPSADYEFLTDSMGQYDVVIADPYSSWIVPTFGGKVVATLHPQAFVKSHDDRRQDLDRFFNAETEQHERDAIIGKYSARYILIDRRRVDVSDEFMESLKKLGKILHVRGDITLLEVN